MLSYEFDPEALEEYEEAVLYFEERREGLGTRFIAAVENTIKAAITMPDAGSILPGAAPELAVRRRWVRGFPAVFLAYVRMNERLYIVAVGHARRHPGYWLDRIRRLAE
jgi:plasmid stabilization system protein ParE